MVEGEHAIDQAWNTIAFPDGHWSPNQDLKAWERLYRQCYAEGVWKVGIEDAQLVAKMGLSGLALEGRGAEAVVVGKTLQGHPDFARLSATEAQNFWFWMACAELVERDYEAAASSLRLLLSATGYGAIIRRRTVAAALTGWGEDYPDEPIPMTVREIARDLLEAHRAGQRRLTQLTNATTAGELKSVLEAAM